MYESQYRDLIDRVHKGNKCIMLTRLSFKNENAGIILQKAVFTEEEMKPHHFSSSMLYEEICNSLEDGKLHLVDMGQNNTILIEPFFPKPRLLVFGGGHIAKPLSEFASRIGFSVTVIDDRPFFANTGRFPAADRVICSRFEDSFTMIDFRKSDFVVIVTRGHRHDGKVLREMLKHELSYVGMIGSKRRVKAMHEELLQEGFSMDKLAFVNAPIGLDISAVTPDEIAISITAQLISYKNKNSVDRFGKEFVYPEFDNEVAAELASPSREPKALITILSSKGSVPRKASAKMAATTDGRTFGSIGGGCSEAEVLTKAKDLMLQPGFFIKQVDMTGEAAESEGMVCGGTMKVLIEAF